MCRLEPGHLLGYGLDDTAVGKHQHQAREKKKKTMGEASTFQLESSRLCGNGPQLLMPPQLELSRALISGEIAP